MRGEKRRGGVCFSDSAHPCRAAPIRVIRDLIFVLTTFLLAACNIPQQTTPSPLVAIASPTLLPTPTLQPANLPTAIPTRQSTSPPTTTQPAPTPNNDAPTPTKMWQALGEGLAHRVLPIGETGDLLYVLRIDPELYQFDVAYRPTQPLTLPQWQAETGALIVFNGGFFTEAYYATGLIIVDGVAAGLSYDFGGMVSIRDGNLALRPLASEPYDSAEMLDAGLQAFPLLVNRDGTAAFTDPATKHARRSVIAQDRAGNVLFIVANRPTFTLTHLSNFLANSDLDLAIALNLDGGPSSGLLIRDPKFEIPSPMLLPTILTVDRK
ncbi:MAG TPA: phosphodiester glycosidase family protein [Anaerolineae bacterium]|nr:phosphodiester glycosidase family protein [Anaerolineae bacterium]